MIDIEGFEGLYAVTEDGQVWSYGRTVTFTGRNAHGSYTSSYRKKPKFLKGGLDKDGYHLVSLVKWDGTKVTAKVHRLVAQAYIPNPDNLPMVNHKDSVTDHNGKDNLEWCTNSDNQLHAIANGWEPHHNFGRSR